MIERAVQLARTYYTLWVDAAILIARRQKYIVLTKKASGFFTRINVSDPSDVK